MKNRYTILSIFIVLIGIFLYIRVNDNNHSLQKDVLDYQVEYQSFIDKDDLIDVDKFNDTPKLARAFEELKKKTQARVERVYKKEKELYRFLRVENTTHYQTKNKDRYNELINENDKLKDELDRYVKPLPLLTFQKNNKTLKEIAIKELANDAVAIDAFKNAVANKNTTTKVQNNCFKKQQNNAWKINLNISEKFCNQLGLNDCNKMYDKHDKEGFIGYTLNNPTKVSKNLKSKSYTSYSDQDFRITDFKDFKNLKDSQVYLEVYEESEKGRKIYKYNIIAIDKHYQLGCNYPI